jgi:hypothetical protein
MDRAVFVYTTFRGLVEAEAAATVISGNGWAACVKRPAQRDIAPLTAETKPAQT